MYIEVNIDALVGPTHHFGGVGVGNEASQSHTRIPSHPRQAALEGLRKASLVAGLGVPQHVLPPIRRPLPRFLSELGFAGDFASMCLRARQLEPFAYSAAFSSAYMWAANAATAAPACDCDNRRTNLVLANLSSSWHRYTEQFTRASQFETMFLDNQELPVSIHGALPPLVPLRDEGAANHMRLCNPAGDSGIHIFVYGDCDEGHAVKGQAAKNEREDRVVQKSAKSNKHMARQTLAASRAVARQLGLDPTRTFFLQQHPDAIDAGVFHNDVIATSHRHLLLMHEKAFFDADAELRRLSEAFRNFTGTSLTIIKILEEQLTLADAVESYLFNSQILTRGDSNAMTIVCAGQCERMPQVRRLLESWIADRDNPIEDVHFVPLEQSMAGGGGPACLRMRLTLPAAAIESFSPKSRLTPMLENRLTKIINDCYPETLEWESLADPENLERYDRAFRKFEDLFEMRLDALAST